MSTSKRIIGGVVVISVASTVWALLQNSGIILGGLPAGIFILVVAIVFAKATGLEKQMGMGFLVKDKTSEE